MYKNWISKAIDAISSGLTNKVESPDKLIVVYRVKDNIRIDIKGIRNVFAED